MRYAVLKGLLHMNSDATFAAHRNWIRSARSKTSRRTAERTGEHRA
jgi:hypothetical protein